MSHDVFISHSTQDRDTAILICKELENTGLTCWMAPRDIGGGEAWDEAIVRGLDNARMVLLVFSQLSNESSHVKRELMRAMEKRKAVLPVRIADVQPGLSLDYVLTGIQWFDAFNPPVSAQLPQLSQQVARIVQESAPVSSMSGSRPAVGVVAPAASGDEGIADSSAQKPVAAAVAAPVQAPAASVPPTMPAAAPSVAARPATDAAPLTNNAQNKPTVALLFKRNAQPDGYVVQMLEKSFQDAGYNVFVDRHMQIGVEWAQEIERNMRTADAVVPILSEASAQSEMLSYQVEIAHTAAQAQQGKPRLLPVRVGFKGTLGDTLDALLNQQPFAMWETQSDDAATSKQLLDALTAKEEVKVDLPPERGAVPLNSKLYVPRPSDEALEQALQRQDTIILIKGGRQMGKTSLVARGLLQARATGSTVVYTDLQKLNTSDLASIQPFYCALAHMLADQLDVETDIEEIWKERRAPSVNFEQYLKKYVMPNIKSHLFWALDEVDRLFTTEFGSEVFGLFRSWHNERATDPDTPWNAMTMIIAYATEAHLFIADPNQSPFNVGTRLELQDFDTQQEEALNKLFGSPLYSEEQMKQFNDLVSGQPFLTGRGLYEIAARKLPFQDFVATADRDEGPFGDHLRRILVMLARDPKMVYAVKGVLAGENDKLTMETFYRLRAAGIVVGEGAFNAKMRCTLYENYLRGHLRESA
jgi:hypothetical protein